MFVSFRSAARVDHEWSYEMRKRRREGENPKQAAERHLLQSLLDRPIFCGSEKLAQLFLRSVNRGRGVEKWEVVSSPQCPLLHCGQPCLRSWTSNIPARSAV